MMYGIGAETVQTIQKERDTFRDAQSRLTERVSFVISAWLKKKIKIAPNKYIAILAT
jgi:hypothetical protein